MTHPAGTNAPPTPPFGYWVPPDPTPPPSALSDFRDALGDLAAPVAIIRGENGLAVARGGAITLGPRPANGLPVAAYLTPLSPEQIGDPSFLRDHRLKYPYMTGAMANGIGSVEVVEAMSEAGMLGSFGAAGLSLERITQAIDRLQADLGDAPFCVNLIHSPGEPAHEMATAELLLAKRVRLVEASAYLDLTPAIVRYRAASPDNRVIAKVSRVEVATKFLSPPPERLLKGLVSAGHLTEQQAAQAQKRPVADDLTVEADSGGHTDNRPAITLLPTMIALRDRLQKQFRFQHAPRVGLAGGIATPASVAAAFAMGAAYVVTGSVNQACVESGSSDAVRKMLAEAGQADVIMAPAADMFEMGVRVQVLKRGTMFAMRAAKLFELYRNYPSWEAIPEADRVQVEKTYFRASFDEIWTTTKEFFIRRDATQLPRAEADPKHRMALVFRWYLGLSSRWANCGEPGRQLDYQIWCGPAMGAFNEWAKGSFLEDPRNRTVTTVAFNLLLGACVILRRQALRQCGIHLGDDYFDERPLTRDEIERRLR
jgi:trans-AT polyketide synthase/acyltransferase/oxidoreductase domain-containing protein